MRYHVGTSGFSYDEWKGSFYPEDLPKTKMLAYYARHFGAVEINNTFYRMPKESVLEGWMEQVPDDFSFVLKVHRRITHQKKLQECEDDVAYLLGQADVLGERRGPFLVQTPPWLKKDTERLTGFLETLPEGTRAAFEFRSSSWFDHEVYGILRDREMALVVSDMDDGDEPPVVPTAAYGYARLRRTRYDDDELESWARRFEETGWERCWVFFKHEEEGTGPELAGRFERITGG